ncbi:hypothetical protein IW262DRAFT_1459425 [Armillaria fumosa]|nr:hypothetical protein IW262DRAFT_1459425 [Armillaria fumosa]
MPVAGAVSLSDRAVVTGWCLTVPVRRQDCIIDVSVDLGAKAHSQRSRKVIFVPTMLPSDYGAHP